MRRPQSRLRDNPVLLIVGKGEDAWEQAASFREENQNCDLCAVNHAGIDPPLPVKHWYAYDREMLEIMVASPGPAMLHSCNLVAELKHRYRYWPLIRKCGGSALQAARCALRWWGYSGVVLAGVGLSTGVYKDIFLPAFTRFYPELRGGLRSLGGLTADLYGKPTKEWIHGRAA